MVTRTTRLCVALSLAAAGTAHAQVAPSAPAAPSRTAQSLDSTILLPATGDLPCRSALVRLWVSLPSSGPFPLLAGLRPGSGDDPVTAGRAQCLPLLDAPLVLFENDIPPSPAVPAS